MSAEQLVNKMHQLEAEGKPAYYVYIAKAALWAVSAVLFGVVVVGTRRAVFAYQYQPEVIANVIAAAQAVGVICLSVLGYRGMKRK